MFDGLGKWLCCEVEWTYEYRERRTWAPQVEVDIEPQAAIEPQANFWGHFMLHFDGIARSGNCLKASWGFSWSAMVFTLLGSQLGSSRDCKDW